MITEDKIIISTPDFGRGHDILCMADTIKCLKQIQYLHSFVIVQKADDHKLNDDPLFEAIKLLVNVFGEGFLSHLVLCFTRNSKSRQSKSNKDQIIQDYSKHFSSLYDSFQISPWQFAFVDSDNFS